ncbi:tweedleC [Haematobia irritans]|uniref:tweedleC n=1 Tax=Haematobia irritans TaxID=7368 RepID=UPI003F4F77B8
MRFFVLFSCLALAVVSARPEPPVSQYLPPNQRGGHAIESHVYQQQLPSDLGFTGFGSHSTDAVPSADTTAPADNAILGSSQEDSYNAAYRHSSSSQYQSGYDNGPTETQVHKHIYVHVPPKDFEEDDAIQPRVTHQSGPKQKHYKIVFIKAPAAPAIRPPVIPPALQNEEKTLIYVLHKKPEASADIVIPTPAPTKPSKPEVFFIKYKTKKDEAPVYGPPPATYNSERRSAVEESSEEYSSPLSNDVNDYVIDPSQYEQQLPTTGPLASEESQAPNSESQISEIYNAPTAGSYVDDEVQTTAAEPSNQYLSPETTSAPIVVADMEDQPRTPAPVYGAPNRFFVKRRNRDMGLITSVFHCWHRIRILTKIASSSAEAESINHIIQTQAC